MILALMLITLFPTANAVYSGGGLTNPNNAHAVDGVYATALPGQNANQGTTYKSFGFDSVLPAVSEITKVQFVYKYKTDTALSIATARVKARVATVEQANHDDTGEPASNTLITVNATLDRTWVRADLLDAAFDVVLEARQSNDATLVTFSFDSIGVEVTYFNMACAPALEACQIEDMQGTVIGMLDERGIIQRQDLIDDQRGGLKPADINNPWPAVQSSAPCRVDAMRIPSAHATDYRLTVDGGFDVSFIAGTDIRNKDRVQVSTLGNRVFKIIGPRYASDEILRVMACEEIT